MKEAAIILGDSLLRTPYGKTAHGLLRKSDRFQIVGVVEFEMGTGDAGALIGELSLEIPLTGSVEAALTVAPVKPTWAIVGIASPGGKMSPTLRSLVLSAANNGLSIINGLHDKVAEDAEIAAAVARHAAKIIDIDGLRSHLKCPIGQGKYMELPRHASRCSAPIASSESVRRQT